VIHRAPACTTPVRSHTFFSSAYELRKLGECTLHRRADPQRIPAAEGDDEGVIDGADGSAGFVGILVASTSTCRSPYERGRPKVVTPSNAAAPLLLLGAARLRCGSACPRTLRAPRAPRGGRLSSRWRRRSRSPGPGVVHSLSSRPLSRHRHWEWWPTTCLNGTR
jgi:hypothetical protein